MRRREKINAGYFFSKNAQDPTETRATQESPAKGQQCEADAQTKIKTPPEEGVNSQNFGVVVCRWDSETYTETRSSLAAFFSPILN